MASDCGSSSSSELDDEPSLAPVDAGGSILSRDAESNVPADPESTSEDELPSPVAMTARAYQLEMLEESQKQNIIVAVCRAPRTIVPVSPR